MNKKIQKISFFIYPILFLSIFSSSEFYNLKNNLVYSSEEIVSEGNLFIEDMNSIKQNSDVALEDDILSYDPTTKTYNLKQDIDFTNFEGDLYDGDGSTTLVPDSTFNGNGYEIQNRYNSESLVNHFNLMLTSNYRTTNNSYVNVANKLFKVSLFSETNGADVYNLNFNNSPFAFGIIETNSEIRNVNLYNVSIENLTFNSTKSDFVSGTYYNIFNFALFSFAEQTNVEISNSNFYNINISNNTFNLQQLSENNNVLDNKNKQNISIVFSLFGNASNESDPKEKPESITISNIELNNLNIRNNTIFVNNYSNNDSRASKTSFVLSPINSILGSSQGTSGDINSPFYETDLWLLDDESSDKSKSSSYEPKIAVENNLFYKNIFIHNINFLNNNVEYSSNSSLNGTSQYFNTIPFFQTDGFYTFEQKNLVLDNINIGNTDVTIFVDAGKNTVFNISNNILWSNENNSDEFTQQLINSNEYKLEQNWSTSSTQKNLYFDSNYWNTNENEELSLYNSNTIYNPDFELDYSQDSETYGDLILKVNLNYHNYYLGYENDDYYISITNQDDVEIYNEPILDSNEIKEINLTKLNLDIYNEIYYLNINASNYNSKYNLKIKINDYLYNSWLIFDFQNYILDSSLIVDFQLSDPFLEFDYINVDLYKKNKKKSSEKYYSNQNNEKTTSFANLEFNDINKINSNDWYLVISFQIKDKQVSYNDSNNNFVLGDLNYLSIKNSPNSWFYYYWWIILLIVLLIILIAIILLIMYFLKNKNKQIDDFETRIQLIDEKYSNNYQNEYDSNNYEETSQYYENEYDSNNYEETSQYYENEYDFNDYEESSQYYENEYDFNNYEEINWENE